MRTSIVETARPKPRFQLVEVPYVREIPVNQATRKLQAAGLKWKIIKYRPQAWVWRQSPHAGKMVARGSVVTLELRTGPIP
jgi:beta-lactam-binding protein with PASTA domain